MGSRALPTLPPPSPRSFFKSLRRSISPRFVCLWAGANEGPTDKSPQISLPPLSTYVFRAPPAAVTRREKNRAPIFESLTSPISREGGKRRPWLLLPLLLPFRRRRIPEKVVSAPSPPFSLFLVGQHTNSFPILPAPLLPLFLSNSPPLFRVHFWFLIKAHAAADARPRKRGGLFSPPLFPLSLRGAS